MNKEIQTLVALQLLSQKDDITIHNYDEGNKIVEDKSINILAALKVAMKAGLEIMLPLEKDEWFVNNGKITFIEKMMHKHKDSKEVIHFLYEQITQKDLEKAHPRFVYNIYSALEDTDISIKKMFELGFDFKQGSFDEESKANNGDLDFFECCLYYKKDFDFSYKYDGEFTLKEAVEDTIQYKKGNRLNTDKEEVLLNFIEKVMMMQNLDNKLVETTPKDKETKLKI